MAADPVQRRLAAILAADVAGYSRLMGEDEIATRARFNSHFHDLIEPTIAKGQGRVVKTTGDGLLAEFPSVVDAVNCAVEIQRNMIDRNADDPQGQRMEFRIGVNLGDVIIEGDDIHGDGVNVASRLEKLSEPGGVVVSRSVHEQVKSKIDFGFDDLGPREVKNIVEPVHAFRIILDPGTTVAAVTATIFDKPSIAVLPFDNMSGDTEQEYFSDGITDDLITALCRIRQFRVVARNSTFSFKGQFPDVRRVAEELNVRYVIEGSVRRAGNQIRLTAQLIDGDTGNHVWAERYDRSLDDIFSLQDELANTIVGAVEPAMGRAEQERANKKPPENLDAWESYQRGIWHLIRRTKLDMEEARKLFERAITLDSQFAQAYAGYARTFYFDVLLGFSDDGDEEALEAARKAVDLDNEDAGSHTALGQIYYVNRNNERAIPEFEAAIRLNPSYATAHHHLGRVLAHTGRPEEALPHLQAAIRLSPKDGEIAPFHAGVALANLYLRRHEDAVEWAREAIRLPGIQWPCGNVPPTVEIRRAGIAG